MPLTVAHFLEKGLAGAPFTFDFKAKSLVDVLRTVNKIDTLTNNFANRSLTVRERTNQPKGPRDIVLKFSNPFKAVCDSMKFDVADKYAKDAEEKVEQDCSLT